MNVHMDKKIVIITVRNYALDNKLWGMLNHKQSTMTYFISIHIIFIQIVW